MLVVASGQRTDRAFRCIPGWTIETIPCECLRHHNLWAYTVVVIASWTNDVVLASSNHKLSDYVNKGGILICLGCQCNEAQWIPFCNWSRKEAVAPSWDNSSEDYSKIFLGVDTSLLQFHEFYGHGTLEPPTNAKILATGDGRPMLVVVDKDVKGAALITTIDPDFHAYAGIRILDKTNEQEKMREARRFIENIFRWAAWKFDQQHSVPSYVFRRMVGSFNFRLLYMLFALILWPLSFGISVKYLMGKYDMWVAIPGVASVVGLAIMITDKFIERKRMTQA